MNTDQSEIQLTSQGVYAEAERFIVDNDVHYVLRTGRYFVKRENEWIPIPPPHFKRFFAASARLAAMFGLNSRTGTSVS